MFVDNVHKKKKKITMEELYKQINRVIKDSFVQECASLQIRSLCENHQLKKLSFTTGNREMQYYAFEKAETYILSSKLSNVVNQCQINIYTSNATARYLFYIHSSVAWTMFIHCIVIAHILAAFWESSMIQQPSGFSIDVQRNVILLCVEGVFIFIELLDAFVRIFKNHTIPQDIFSAKHERVFSFLYLGVVILLIIDLIIQAFLEKNIEYAIPIRPLLLIFINEALQEHLITFLFAIKRLLPVLCVCLTISDPERI